MPQTELARAAETFSSRLKTLLRLIDKAEAQWREKGEDPATLLAGRLAADMFPLPYQIVFACNQANDLAAWIEGGERLRPKPDTLSLAELRAHVEATIRRQEESVAGADESLLDRDKHIDLTGGRSAVLPGRDYIADWLLPNFYFHLVTAYDVLRHLGVSIGKADFLGHLGGRIRQAA